MKIWKTEFKKKKFKKRSLGSVATSLSVDDEAGSSRFAELKKEVKRRFCQGKTLKEIQEKTSARIDIIYFRTCFSVFVYIFFLNSAKRLD